MKFLKRRMKRLRDLRHDGGNITIIFALTAVPMFLGLGAAVDYVYVVRESSKLRAAADSALMAVVSSDKFTINKLTGSTAPQTIADAQKTAKFYFDKNYKRPLGGGSVPTPAISVSNGQVRLKMAYTIPAPLFSTLGLRQTTVNIDIAGVKTDTSALELAIVVDNHVAYQARNPTNFQFTKISLGTFVSKLYTNLNASAAGESASLRLALVPFAGAVRLDRNASDFNWSWLELNGNSPLSKLSFTDPTWNNNIAWSRVRPSANVWNGCVEARAGAAATSDDPPISPISQFPLYFAPDEPTYSGSGSSPAWFKNSYVDIVPESTGLSAYDSIADSDPTKQRMRQENQAKYALGANLPTEASNRTAPGPWFNCAATPAVPLTYDRYTVDFNIMAMQEIGQANVIPEGLAWAWRMLSPTEPYTKVAKGPSLPAATIAPYGDSKWKKAMVLIVRDGNNVGMTGNESGGTYGYDFVGSNVNRTTYSAYGYGGRAGFGTEGFKERFGTTLSSDSLAVGPWNAKIDENMMTVCSNIKNAGITLYVVVVGSSDSNLRSRMQTCATTNSSPHYYVAMTNAAVDTALAQIATSLTPKKSVTKLTD